MTTAMPPTPPASLDATEQRRLCLYAQRDPDGAILGTFLVVQGDQVGLWEESGLADEVALPLPPGALEAVAHRYGKPLEDPKELAAICAESPEPPEHAMRPLKVPLGEGRVATLRRFRYMPFGWVHPADYILCELPDPAAGARTQLELALPSEPLAVPAPLMASALAALARAASR